MEIPQFDPFVDAITRRFQADDPSVESKRLEHANVQRIAAAFESLGRGDIDSFCGGFTEDVELEIHAPAEFAFVRLAKGREKFRAAIEHNFAMLAEQQAEVLNVVAQGHSIVLIGRERGRLGASGHPYEAHFVYEFTLRGTEISRVFELAVTNGAA
jgi:ketosteroid isomerase-like protein